MTSYFLITSSVVSKYVIAIAIVSEQGSTLFSDVPTQQFYIFYSKIKYFIKYCCLSLWKSLIKKSITFLKENLNNTN